MLTKTRIPRLPNKDKAYMYNTSNCIIFENRYKELKKINVYYNEQAVDYAVLTYESKRKYLNVTLFGFFNKLITKHDDAKRQAIKEFMNRRRGTDYNNDPFYDDLLRKIEKVNNSL
ncbi:hypothetical protein HF086_015938 [Spodoptera exigua]|uniref:Uncharacterized protein n=1 Tax=Spodoptera exigua TaxID=7107 RepID=A0A922M1R5_SPOEX|nr:hypothetical protein HF086_015938 [Spodoptera exigua]